jgi:hypothetical protein
MARKLTGKVALEEWATGALCARALRAQQSKTALLADERLPFGALAEADLHAPKRCPPVLIRRSRDRAVPNLPRPPGGGATRSGNSNWQVWDGLDGGHIAPAARRTGG